MSRYCDGELSKINARIKKAYKYRDISEAFDEVLDDSEGAGLGLIMAMMIFKNIGMPPEAFRIYRKDDLTIAAIAIPQTMDKVRTRVQIAEEILSEIEEIPAFPENIIRIQKLCANPDATIKEIAGAISLDPGLTTSILKLANSAGYIHHQENRDHRGRGEDHRRQGDQHPPARDRRVQGNGRALQTLRIDMEGLVQAGRLRLQDRDTAQEDRRRAISPIWRRSFPTSAISSCSRSNRKY